MADNYTTYFLLHYCTCINYQIFGVPRFVLVWITSVSRQLSGKECITEAANLN